MDDDHKPAPDILSERWSREMHAILDELEWITEETKGAFKQASDREALDTCERIERKRALGTRSKV